MAIITGGSTNDTLNGTSSADTITGNAGNDSMDGGSGADTYIYNLGDGHDTVTSSGGLFTSNADALKFGPGITMADVNARLDGTTLVLTLTSNRGSVRVLNWNSGSDAGRLRIDFNDGLSWNTETIKYATDTDIETNGKQYDGDAGNNTLYGGNGDDLISGGAGNDTIYGDDGYDVIAGETGQNVYYFGRGDDQDFISITSIVDGGAGQSDTVRLGSDISMADVSVVDDSGDLAFYIRGTKDVVSLQGVADDPSLFNASVVFADGARWDTAALQRKLVQQHDNYTGTAGNDNWDGGLGNDTLNGAGGNDILYGSLGNDIIDGGAGVDTFYFGRGDGRDTIVANSTASAGDKLVFGAVIGIGDVEVKQEGGDVVLNLINSLDSVRLQGYVGLAAASRPLVRFADGSTWDSVAIDRKLNGAGQTFTGTTGADALDGGLGNDTLNGSAGNDTLYGDAGNDLMDGGDGADTYVYGLRDGFDTVVAGAASAGASDRVRFGNGIMLSDLAASRSGNDLILMLPGGKDGLRVQNYFGIAAADRVKFEFQDGLVWDATSIDRKITVASENLTGSDADDFIDGGLGDDTISVLGGTNVLYGDAGNDLLIGGDGGNTYYFGYGDGHDTVRASTSFLLEQEDIIQFGSGITFSDVDASIDGSDLLFRLRATGDTLRFEGFVSNPRSFSAVLRFGDGTELDLDQMIGLYQGVDQFTNGSSAGDVLHAGLGQDTVSGFGGDDTLYGDAGADTLDGGEGADSYLYGRGDGRDLILAGTADSAGDQLLMSYDLDTTDLDFIQNGQDLVLSVRGTLEKVSLKDYFSQAVANRMAVRFADGLVMNGDAVQRKLGLSGNTLTSTAGDDRLEGNQLNETITGLGGNDTLYGDGGADSMDGGAGADAYLFGRGDGRDTIAGGASDSLRLSRAISMADIDVGLSGADLLLSVKGSQDSVLIKGYTSVAAADRTRIDFLAGGAWDAAAVDRKLTSVNDALTGTANGDVLDGGLGNDTISGLAGDDTLYGDAGSDQLNGGVGADTYVFGLGDGADRILSGTAIERRGDVVNFGGGITMADVAIAMSGAALVVSVRGTTDSITIDNYKTGAAAEWVSLRFADGAVLRGEAIDVMLAGQDDGLWGGSFNDAFHGGVGNDVIAGMDGDDTMYGGVGNDWMGGGYGSDTYYFGRGDGVDTVTAYSADPEGSQDRIIFGADIAASDLTFARNGDDLILSIVGASDKALLQGWFERLVSDRTLVQFGDGTSLDSAAVLTRLTSSSGVVLVGTAGADVLNGTAVNDTLDGGLGNDQLNGLAGNDSLVGGADNDTLDGGAGIDTMAGGAGNDVYSIDNAADVIIEGTDGGFDEVYSSVSYTMGEFVEYAELTGTENINVTGNNNGIQIWGNEGNNLVTGGTGADELSGNFGGLDTLVGGAGDDLYYVLNATDVVVEGANAGYDEVKALANGFRLTDNVESLHILGSFSVGFGNDGDNGIFGNGASNNLSGLGGDDVINGYGGNDTIIGGRGDDLLGAGKGNDTYIYNADDGYDFISNLDATGNDTLRIQGATESQIWFKMYGRDLAVSIIGRDGEVTVGGWTRGTSYQIDTIRLDNGKTLSASKVMNLVSAMAAFTEPGAGQTTLPTAYQTSLNSVIAANWV